MGVSQQILTKSTRDKPSLPNEVPGFPRHTQSLGASRRKAGALPALSLDIFWLKGTQRCSKLSVIRSLLIVRPD
jgi:hypothetical protein